MRLTLFILTHLFTTILTAQEQNKNTSSLGIKVNIGYGSYLEYNKSGIIEINSYSKIPAYALGIQYTQTMLNNHLNFFTDFSLVKRGYEFRYWDINIDQVGTEQLHYLSLPTGVLLKIRHIYLGGGIGLDYMINRITHVDGKKFNDNPFLMYVPEKNFVFRAYYLLKCGVKFNFKNADFIFVEFAYDKGFVEDLSNFGIGVSYNYCFGKKNKAE
jgi:hypothetical protein